MTATTWEWIIAAVSGTASAFSIAAAVSAGRHAHSMRRKVHR